MEISEYPKGAVICSEGDPVSQIMIITTGSVEAAFDGKTFHFGQGDVLGICALSLGMYSYTYTAVSDVTIATYPYKNLSALDTLFQEKSGVAYLMVCSMCRQILNLLQYKISLQNESDRAFESAKKLYPQYEELCAQYAFTAKKLASASEAQPFSGLDLIDEWVYTYYMEIKNLDQVVHKEFFNNRPGIALGFIRKAAEDADNAINACRDYKKYLDGISQVFLNAEGHDLFAVVSELHYSSVNIKGSDAAIGMLMTRLTKLLGSMAAIDPVYYQTRLSAYKETLDSKRTSAAETAVTAVADVSGVNRNLADSLNVILDYSGCPDETKSKFTRSVQEFTMTDDKSSADDAVYSLRKQLTAMFYEIYQSVFIRSLSDAATPTIIKMFLNFGYVDAALAEPENADYLYSIADSLKGDPSIGVYTISEWLAAVYNGKKEPCRSELDEDYPTYIRALKTSQNLSDKEANRLLADPEGRLRFELENVFPVTNRITSGTVSTFCPAFSSHNVLRQLDVSLVKAAAVKETIDEIRSIDFSAYYRPMMFEYPELGASSGSSKETLNVEVLPDVILMPNVGVRGIMWQDIEGRKRNTPSRMFIPLFLQNDLKTLFIRLTSEFRWELCKRIQGARWNDLTDPSITSEFCDYLQFYKTNRELSTEAKEVLRNMLVRARNNYKNVFSIYYADWITYESNGISRLNKYVRKMMFTYCPFPSAIRDKLANNPQYSNLINRYNTKQKQRDKQLTYVMQKFTQINKKIPQELYDEQEFIAR